MRVPMASAMRVIAALAAFSMAASACSGGDSSESKGGSDHLRVGMVGIDISSIDPARGFALSVDSYVLEFLMKLSPTGKVEPNLAESVDQPDPTTYVYHLRDDVTFSNGNPLTADDVVNSLDYARDPKFPDSAKYSMVKSVEAQDDQTVVVTLNEPSASWEYTSATAGYIFEKKFQQENKKDFGKPGVGVIGTGPYVVDTLDPTTGVEFSANPDYWGGDVPISKVTMTIFADETSEALAFRAGEVDIVFPADPRGFESAAATELVTVPGTKQGLFTINVQVAPWDDVHVRRAVAYALNREEIINVSGGGATPDYTVIPPAQLQSIASESDVDALVDSLPTYEYDLDKAKEELAQSAFPDGFEAVLETYKYGSFVKTSEAIAGQLSEIGLDITVQVDSVAEFAKTFSEPHTDVPIQYTYFNNNTPDPGAMPQQALHSDSAAIGLNNFSDYKNPEVDNLIDQGASTTDPDERFSIYSQMLQIVGDDVPLVPLYAGDNNLAISDDFTWPTFNTYSTDHTPYILEIQAK
jgi:peptide/nickel transport system substrate-binding protein